MIYKSSIWIRIAALVAVVAFFACCGLFAWLLSTKWNGSMESVGFLEYGLAVVCCLSIFLESISIVRKALYEVEVSSQGLTIKHFFRTKSLPWSVFDGYYVTHQGLQLLSKGSEVVSVSAILSSFQDFVRQVSQYLPDHPQSSAALAYADHRKKDLFALSLMAFSLVTSFVCHYLQVNVLILLAIPIVSLLCCTLFFKRETVAGTIFNMNVDRLSMVMVGTLVVPICYLGTSNVHNVAKWLGWIALFAAPGFLTHLVAIASKRKHFFWVPLAIWFSFGMIAEDYINQYGEQPTIASLNRIVVNRMEWEHLFGIIKTYSINVSRDGNIKRATSFPANEVLVDSFEDGQSVVVEVCPGLLGLPWYCRILPAEDES